MPKKVIFIHTETTGIPKGLLGVTKKNFILWPRLIAVHCKIGSFDKSKEKIVLDKKFYRIINPDDFKIPEEAINVHKITNKIANKKGVELVDVLYELKEYIGRCDFIVTHNSTFHIGCLQAEFMRCDIEFPKIKVIDIINFNHTYEFPKLDDLYYNLYDRNFKKSHPRKSNINIVIKCFELLYNNHLNKIKEKPMIIPKVQAIKKKKFKPSKSSKKIKDKIFSDIRKK